MDEERHLDKKQGNAFQYKFDCALELECLSKLCTAGGWGLGWDEHVCTVQYIKVWKDNIKDCIYIVDSHSEFFCYYFEDYCQIRNI